MKGPNLHPDEIETLSLQEAWQRGAMSIAEQTEWARQNLTQEEIDNLCIATVELWAADCRAKAAKAA